MQLYILQAGNKILFKVYGYAYWKCDSARPYLLAVLDHTRRPTAITFKTIPAVNSPGGSRLFVKDPLALDNSYHI